MLTLGVDLASQDAKTAICRVRWDGRVRSVVDVDVGIGDQRILELSRTVDAAGIDAPFGWPMRFAEAVGAWMNGEPWPGEWDATSQPLLRLRETDRWIARQVKKWPLSVSADSIAMCAMRAARLLSAVGGTVDRVHGPYYEVYPGAALVRWDVEAKGYKQDAEVREKVLDALGPLEMGLAERTTLIASDHALDALLCALVAREAATGRTHHPPPELADAAAREGWIHLPKPV